MQGLADRADSTRSTDTLMAVGGPAARVLTQKAAPSLARRFSMTLGASRPRAGKQMSLTNGPQQQFPAEVDDGVFNCTGHLSHCIFIAASADMHCC